MMQCLRKGQDLVDYCQEHPDPTEVDQSVPLQVGDHATGDAHNVRWCRTEVVVPRSRGSPHLVVLQQIRIDEHTQLCAVSKGRHATFVFGNPKGGPPSRTTHPSGGEDLVAISRSGWLQRLWCWG